MPVICLRQEGHACCQRFPAIASPMTDEPPVASAPQSRWYGQGGTGVSPVEATSWGGTGVLARWIAVPVASAPRGGRPCRKTLRHSELSPIRVPLAACPPVQSQRASSPVGSQLSCSVRPPVFAFGYAVTLPWRTSPQHGNGCGSQPGHGYNEARMAEPVVCV